MQSRWRMLQSFCLYRSGGYKEGMGNLIIGAKPPKKCAFLNGKNICKIYDRRPARCREYPLMIDRNSKTINISSDCPRSSVLLKEIKKSGGFRIKLFSFFEKSMRTYLDEED